MALRVWLPLNGSLENKGISDITVTNNGATVDNNGKIGKCYSFNNNSISITSTVLQNIFQNSTQAFSFATWIYLNTDETDRVIIFGNYSANPFVNWELTADGKQRLCAGGTSNFTNKSSGTAVPKTAWTHIAVTYDGNTTTFYQNGIKTDSATGANTITTKTPSSTFYLGSDTRTGATRLKGKLNDVRIYDHCLSPLEIKEISQGLILHYKLDEIIGNNILTDTNREQSFIVPTSSYSDVWQYGSIVSPQPNEQFTLSFEAKSSLNGYVIWPFLYNNTSGTIQCASIVNSQGPQTNRGDGGNPLTLTTNYEKYWVTWTFNSVTTTSAKRLMFRLNTNANAPTVWIRNPKLERGSGATGWGPAAGEINNQQYIPDSSGYGNDGTVIDSLTTEMNDTDGRYLIAIKFPTNTAHIQLPVITYSNFGSSYTFSWWEYLTTLGNSPMPWGFSDGNRLNCYHVKTSMLCWNTGNGTSNPFEPNITSTTLLNGWHHLVITGDGTVTNLYIDGEYKAKAKTYVGLTGTQIWLSGWANSTSYTMVNNKISDFRIYATALSAEDIVTLYHTPAQIDNLGGIHGFEANEKQANIFRYELINPYAKNPSAVGTGEWGLRNGEWAMNIRPAPFYQNLVDNKSGFLENKFKPNTQYVFNLWIDGDDVIYNNNNVACGLQVVYSDGSIENLTVTGGSKGFQHKLYISNASKSVDRVASYYHVSSDTYYRWDSYICPVDKESIVKEGLIKSTQFIENNSLASIHKSGSMLSPNIIEK